MTEQELKECSHKFITDYDSGEIVCNQCGFVNPEKTISSEREWRAYSPEEKSERERVGPPTTSRVHDKGLSTVIDYKDFVKLKPQRRGDFYRLRKRNISVRVQTPIERNLAVALAKLVKCSESLNLPKHVLEQASVDYRKAVKKRLVRGRSVDNLVAASLYSACRLNEIARTIKEVAYACNVGKKGFKRAYRYLIQKLEIAVPCPDAKIYAAKYSNIFELSGKAEQIAIKILDAAKGIGLHRGRGPGGLGAAATYIASILTNEEKTQREIAAVADVTEVTVRNRYKELLEKLSIEISL